jgi:hypothetical protein
MNTRTRIRFTLALVLVLLSGVALWATLSQAAPRHVPLAQGGAPTVISYQGEVRVAGTAYTGGSGYFKFAVVDSPCTTLYWSNDGTGDCSTPPTAAVQLDVSDGLFGVLLGDTMLSGMTQPLTAAVFDQPDRYLRVWFSDDGNTFSRLEPDTRIAAAPYALQAEQAVSAPWSGLTGVPSAYTPTVHAHLWADISNPPSAYTPTAHIHPWGEITAAPSAYTPTAHTHPGGDITSAVPTATLAFSATQAPWSGITGAPAFQEKYAQVVVVAKSGGDYTSVQAAINSISDAAADKPYLVWVAPGVYSETVTVKPHVHLQGAGQEATIITSTVSDGSWPPMQATLVLARNTSLHDLTVGNNGTGAYNVALLGTAGTTETLVADVTARVQGSGTDNYAIFLSGAGTGVILQQVTALGENGSDWNCGLYNHGGAMTMLQGGTFTGRGGSNGPIGIYNYGSGTMLEVTNITALGENGSPSNMGLANAYSATAKLRGGSFTGRGGAYTFGVRNSNNGTTLEATGVTALGESGGTFNYALQNQEGATAMLWSGSFTGRGGVAAHGIYNVHNGSTLEATSVTALGENGNTDNYGLYNQESAATMLWGGAFIGRGGYGILNRDSGTTLEANSAQLIGATDALYQSDGTVEIGVSLLDGGVDRTGGTLTCFQVYDETYSAYACP